MAFTGFFEILQLNNVLLIILLLIVLVIAFKVLKIFFETFLIAILSAVFYIFLGYSGSALDLSATNILFFSLIGTVVFIVYSLLAPFVNLLFKTGDKVFKGTSKVVKGSGFKPRRKKKDKKDEQKTMEKEVILKEIKNE